MKFNIGYTLVSLSLEQVKAFRDAIKQTTGIHDSCWLTVDYDNSIHIHAAYPADNKRDIVWSSDDRKTFVTRLTGNCIQWRKSRVMCDTELLLINVNAFIKRGEL